MPGKEISTDVLVLGGGITGCATAFRLARAGVDVTLLEQGDLGGQASGANAGSLHGQIQYASFVQRGEAWARRWAPALQLLAASMTAWQALSQELGVDLEVTVKGGLLLAETEAQLRSIERKVAIERAHGIASELLTRDDLTRVAPYVADDLVGAELCPIEGKANSLLATAALARGATAAGATVELNTRVVALARQRSGFHVSTTAGTFVARRLVCCAGADTARLTQMLGVTLPVDGHPMQLCVTEPVAPLVSHLIYFAGDRLTLKQARVGSLVIGGGWPAMRHPVSGRPAVDLPGLRSNLAVAHRVVPAIGQARVLRSWTAVNNATPDELPIIGEVAPGLIVGTFPYLGFSAGPIMGELLASLAQGHDAPFDLAPFSPERFG